MRDALDAVIRRLSQALVHFDVDCGLLGDATPVTGDLRARLGDSLCFDQDGQASFLTLYRTSNFRQIECLPHWRLFVITSALGFAEYVTVPSFDHALGGQIARSEFTATLLDAHMLKAWIALAPPTGKAAAARDQEALRMIRETMIEQATVIGDRAPPGLLGRDVVRLRIDEWCTGWPALMAGPLTAETRRINKLPMDANADAAITRRLAELQANGLKEQYDARRRSGHQPT
jgi:hypothetical protein